MIKHHPHRSGTDFRGKFVRRLAHKGSILLGSWSLRQIRSRSLNYPTHKITDRPFLRRQDLPAAERHHPVHPARKIRVMRRNQRRQTLAAHLFQ